METDMKENEQQSPESESENLETQEAELSPNDNNDGEPTMTRVLEAILFASDEPLSIISRTIAV